MTRLGCYSAVSLQGAGERPTALIFLRSDFSFFSHFLLARDSCFVAIYNRDHIRVTNMFSKRRPTRATGARYPPRSSRGSKQE